jgi:hypothetical protein
MRKKRPISHLALYDESSAGRAAVGAWNARRIKVPAPVFPDLLICHYG